MNLSDLAFLPEILIKLSPSFQRDVFFLHGINMQGEIRSYSIMTSRPLHMLFSIGSHQHSYIAGSTEREIVYNTTDGAFSLYF